MNTDTEEMEVLNESSTDTKPVEDSDWDLKKFLRNCFWILLIGAIALGIYFRAPLTKWVKGKYYSTFQLEVVDSASTDCGLNHYEIQSKNGFYGTYCHNGIVGAALDSATGVDFWMSNGVMYYEEHSDDKECFEQQDGSFRCGDFVVTFGPRQDGWIPEGHKIASVDTYGDNQATGIVVAGEKEYYIDNYWTTDVAGYGTCQDVISVAEPNLIAVDLSDCSPIPTPAPTNTPVPTDTPVPAFGVETLVSSWETQTGCDLKNYQPYSDVHMITGTGITYVDAWMSETTNVIDVRTNEATFQIQIFENEVVTYNIVYDGSHFTGGNWKNDFAGKVLMIGLFNGQYINIYFGDESPNAIYVSTTKDLTGCTVP